MIDKEIMDLFKDVSRVLNKHEEMIMELYDLVKEERNTINVQPTE